MKKFIKDNWADPVWSKVFAGIILAILGAIGTLIVAIWNKIPISEIYNLSINNYVTVSYFKIFIVVIILLSIIIPAIYTDVIKFQLKKLKFPTRFNTKKFDLQMFLTGQWRLEFESQKNPSNDRGDEPVNFVNGNQYYIRGKLSFVMTDIQFDESKKELSWTKLNYATNRVHSHETITVTGKKTMIGSDTLGYNLKYTKA